MAVYCLRYQKRRDRRVAKRLQRRLDRHRTRELIRLGAFDGIASRRMHLDVTLLC